MDKQRLDVYCTAFVSTRAKAQDLIKEGKVRVNGNIILKPSFKVCETDSIHIEEMPRYVSRGAYKLKSCIEQNHVDLEGQVVLDIGASTGGFTQVCLEEGARRVYSLDVGHFQLDPLLDQDLRVCKMEGKNGRDIEPTWFEESIDFLCMDVSFISSKTILEPVLSKLSVKHCAILIKPQFECGSRYLNHKGVITNQRIINQIVDEMKEWMSIFYENVKVNPSPIKGRSGNQEYMLYASQRRKNHD